MSEVELQRSLEAILMVVDEPVSELVLAQIICKLWCCGDRPNSLRPQCAITTFF